MPRKRPTCSGWPQPVSWRPQSGCETSATDIPSGPNAASEEGPGTERGETDASPRRAPSDGLISDRAPTPKGHQERGAVLRADCRQRCVFVTHLEPVEFDQECLLRLLIRIEHIERAELDGQDR